jgi:hypothetical protein
LDFLTELWHVKFLGLFLRKNEFQTKLNHQSVFDFMVGLVTI